MNNSDLEPILESILFVSGELVPISKIAAALEIDEKMIKDCVFGLMDKYKAENRGIKIIEVNNSYQMCSAPENFPYIQKVFEKPQKKHLTQTLLETLAIVAYKQPITKAQIEEIRGVNADHAVNKLVEYDLITEQGRLDIAGRPILFATTDNFLKYFGYSNIDDLPQLPEQTELPKPPNL